MAAVLFTDLVGSTELLSRLGEAAFDGVRRAHFAALRDHIGLRGGAEVKTTGDGLLATFPSAADAVGCAVAMQQAVEVHGRAAGVPLAIRVGVSLGDVSFEDGDVFGTPVVEAARLVALARGGQILATSLVRAVAGGRTDAHFADLGCLELKGLPMPVATCEVAWEPLPTAVVPLPPMLSELGRIFVGREAQLDRLKRLWGEVEAGELRVVLLGGEPGVGKTRLAAELAAGVHARGALVLAGRCDEDLGVPYQPFVEALRQFIDHVPGAELEGRLGRYRGELARLVPELGERLPGLPPALRSDPETERYRLFDAVAAWLGEVSADAPVLLVLDDVHWAAKPTLLLLRHVVHALTPHRLLVVATYRDSEVGRGHPLADLLADLRRVGGVERLPLTGLHEADVAAFIAAAAGHSLSDEESALPRAVWAETEGNPFFVVEVLRHLTESGGVEHRDGRWVITVPVEELGIPEGVRDVVGRRLSRLSEAANRCLTIASIAGLEFDPAVVRAAGGLGEDVLLSALDEAVAARILSEVSGADVRYRFAHALIRATLHDEITAARRVSLHRRVAEAIESIHGEALDDQLPALAHHWARASAPAAQAARAIDYATRAGDRALAQLAPDEAAAFYRQAIELVDAAGGPTADGARLELLIALGEAERQAGDGAHRDTLLRAVRIARERGDAGALARAALANCRSSYWSALGFVDEERVMGLEAALEAVGDVETVGRARLLANLAVETVYSGQEQRRRALSDQSLALARALGDRTTLAHVLMPRFFAIYAPDTLAERLANTAELLALAGELADPFVSFIAHFLRARVMLESGGTEEARSHHGQADRLAAELGQPTLRWMVGWIRVAQLVVAARIDDAERVAQATLELGESSGQPDARTIFAAQRWGMRFQQGRLGELVTELTEMCVRFPALPGLAALLAAAHFELGHKDEARSCFERLRAISFDPPRDVLWLGLVTVAADVACDLNDHSSARILHDLLRPYPTAFGILAAVTTGCTAHFLGKLAATLGRHGEAEKHFECALATHARSEAPLLLARTQLENARMLLSRRSPGDTQRARELLGQALATARELGLLNVERRAVVLLGQVA
jgi:class 3 adenylate cyclase/tetratricopeptide (TPR) repeat protein